VSIAVTLVAVSIMALVLPVAPRSAGLPQELPHTCIVIREVATGAVWRSDAKLCATRLSPASTFKLPHALVVLETEVVVPDTVEKWDGVRHPGLLKWDTDHTVVSAMKPSVVWFFQGVARRIGASAMRRWLERMRYGNARTDGDVTLYWLNGTLRISPDEQVEFLQQFYAERLPVRPEWQRLIRGALDQPPGTIENSGGIKSLEGKWPRGATWNAKTGRTEYAGRSVSWLVGELSAAGRGHVFAAAVWRDAGSVGSLDGAHLAAKTFIERGLIAAGGPMD
jgi:beta-lactamase class D